MSTHPVPDGRVPTSERHRGPYERATKPFLDRIAGLLLAIVTLPIVLGIGIGAGLTFRASPLTSEIHVGRNGRLFKLYRVRTGRPDDGPLGPMQRRLSLFLREYSLDELPQFLNIALGQMSMVGPRPMPPGAASRLADWQLERHRVKPGLTGVWQVEARGDTRDLRQNIHYDIQYIDQISFGTDVRLLARTVAALATRREGEFIHPHHTGRLRARFPHIRLVAADLAVWIIALYVAAAGRLDFDWSAIGFREVALAVIVAWSSQLGYGFFVGLYRGRWRLASYEELAWVSTGFGFATAVLLATTVFTPRNLLPRGAMVAAGAFALLGALGARSLARAVYAAQGKSTHQRPYKLLIFGAGEAGIQATEAIWSDPDADALPVAFLDDDPIAWKRRPLGLPVVGGRPAIRAAARRYNADLLLIAMPSAGGPDIETVATTAQEAGLEVRILPRLAKFIDGSQEPVLTSDIRELSLADFLNRSEIHLGLEAIADYLADKKVLITGAGGSIGSVLCRIVNGFGPRQIFKLDHDENALHALQLATDGRALLESDSLVLCDIRDSEAVNRVFETIKPDVVFHTAAHKHVTFLERHPREALKTNVYGTLNLLQAAHEFGVSRFVNISTDKAADPVNVLGKTKRLAEMLAAHFDEISDTTFLSVRFGNVLGSKGSVVPTFRAQIERGDPVTVTHPDVTRYFMTIEEACQLVVQAGAVGGHGDVYVLDMGQPVKIVDLATRLYAQLRPGQPPTITYTGLRPGEKLHEVLSGPNEVLVDLPHELLSRFKVPSLAPELITDDLLLDIEGPLPPSITH